MLRTMVGWRYPQARGAGAAVPAGRAPISESPWKKAPSSITSLGDTSVASTFDPARSSIRCRPCTRPVTAPRMDTTPQPMSASTCPDSPTIRVLSETILPFRRPSIRSVSLKRSSPRNSVPSSMKPLSPSATSPLSLIIQNPRTTLWKRTITRGTRSAAAARPDEQFVEPVELGLAGEGDAEGPAPAPAGDLHPRAEGGLKALLRGPGVGVLAGRVPTPRRAQERHPSLHLPYRQPLPRRLPGQPGLVLAAVQGQEGPAVTRVQLTRGQK